MALIDKIEAIMKSGKSLASKESSLKALEKEAANEDEYHLLGMYAEALMYENSTPNSAK